MAGQPDDVAAQMEELGGTDDPVVLHVPDDDDDRPIRVRDLHQEVDELRHQLEEAFAEVVTRLVKMDLRLTTIQTRVRPAQPTDRSEDADVELDLVARNAALAAEVAALADAVRLQTQALVDVQRSIGDLQRRVDQA